jgi:hypothetical protein
MMKFVTRRRNSGLSTPGVLYPLWRDPGPKGFPKSIVGQLISYTAYDIVREFGVRIGKSTK